MRSRTLSLLALLLGGLAACDSRAPGDCCSIGGQTALRIVNGFTAPVDVLIDGQVIASAVAPGAADTVRPSIGAHTVTLRPNGASSGSSSQSITSATGALNTVAVLRESDGTIGSATLDDTNSVVPAGATKVRVIHLAPNAGTLQVYRTQPDFSNPVIWQFPFNYQTDLSSLSAPFVQSTVGTWEIRVWQTPADASGWDTATARVTLSLASGEKRTVVILDKAGGGVRLMVL